MPKLKVGFTSKEAKWDFTMFTDKIDKHWVDHSC